MHGKGLGGLTHEQFEAYFFTSPRTLHLARQALQDHFDWAVAELLLRLTDCRDIAACVEAGKDPLGFPLRTIKTVACDTLASFAMHFWVGRGPGGFTFGRRQLELIIRISHRSNGFSGKTARLARPPDCDKPAAEEFDSAGAQFDGGVHYCLAPGFSYWRPELLQILSPRTCKSN
jgi:hypothetical protein